MVDLGDVIEGLRGADFFRWWDQRARYRRVKRISNKLGAAMRISIYSYVCVAMRRDSGGTRNLMGGTPRSTFALLSMRGLRG